MKLPAELVFKDEFVSFVSAHGVSTVSVRSRRMRNYRVVWKRSRCMKVREF